MFVSGSTLTLPETNMSPENGWLLHLNPFKSILLHGIFHDLGHLFVGWDLILLLVLLQASDDPRAICNVIFQIRDTVL